MDNLIESSKASSCILRHAVAHFLDKKISFPNIFFPIETIFFSSGTIECAIVFLSIFNLWYISSIVNWLPAKTKLYICHDYGPGGREVAWETTVREQRKNNIHVREGITEDEFVVTREKRDATLSMPKLIVPATQVNMRAGSLPEEENNGVSYIKLPINKL